MCMYVKTSAYLKIEREDPCVSIWKRLQILPPWGRGDYVNTWRRPRIVLMKGRTHVCT